MGVQSLLALDLRRIVNNLTRYLRKEFPDLVIPRDVLEISLVPELDLLYIRFGYGKDRGFGEYIGKYIHVFVEDNRVVSVEITPFSKFLKEIVRGD